jgi:drug/metabolite transporter (DMT)-like permease
MKQIGKATLVIATLFWAVGIYVTVTPTNRLNAQGFGSVFAYLLTVGSLLAFVMAIVGIKTRKTTPTAIFVVNQVLCWSFAVVPVLLLITVMTFGRGQ